MNIIDLKTAPAFKLLIMILLVMVPCVFLAIPINWILLLLILSFVLYISAVIKRMPNMQYITGTVTIAFLLSLSVNMTNHKVPNVFLSDVPAIVQGKIIKILNVKDKSTRFIVEGNIDTKQLKRENATILLTVFGSEKENKVLKPGAIIYSDVISHLPRKKISFEEFNEKQYLNSIGCSWVAISSIKKTALIKQEFDYYYWQYHFSNSVKKLINKTFSQRNSPIVLALLTGDQSKIPLSGRTIFSKSGTAHLLSVSGLHTAIIAIMLIFMLSFVKNDYLKFIFLLIGLLGFVALVGFQPSAVRSAAMAILYYFLKILGRKPNTLNVVSFVLLFYIVVNPSIIMNISFQMSGFAVLGMIYFYYPIANGLNKVFPKFVSNSFAISISASLIVSPLTAYYFGIYSIISPFANFIVVPTMSLGLIYSIVSLVLLKIPLIGEIFISATEFFIDLSVFISAYSSNFKFAYSEGTLAIYISLAILIFGIYILSSKNLNNFIFKTAVSGTFIFFISFLLPQNKIEKLQIIPRQQAVIIDIPPAKDKKLLVIIDRKPAQYPIRDIALENYINNYNGKMQIAVCGNAGINLIDNLKKKVETVEIDLKDQEKLRHKLKINQYLSQIINYNVKTN